MDHDVHVSTIHSFFSCLLRRDSSVVKDEACIFVSLRLFGSLLTYFTELAGVYIGTYGHRRLFAASI